MVEMMKSDFEIKSNLLTPIQRLVVTLISGIFTGFFVFLIFLILDGSDWYIIDGGIFVNLMLLFSMGTLMAHFYFNSETKRFKDGNLIFELTKIHTKKNNVIIRTYPKKMFIKARVDFQFYGFIGMRRITFLFQPIRGKKLQLESILVKKTDVEQLIKQVEAYQRNI
jgi:hypothetical protein